MFWGERLVGGRRVVVGSGVCKRERREERGGFMYVCII